ncbi:hypothetical protein SFC57_23985 [Niallia circulans]|uniref:hypothetical protein n=1 Tax=Bacillaceae TaxID=186817 RepID=UPI003978352F
MSNFNDFLKQQNQGKKENPITSSSKNNNTSLSEAEKKQRNRRNIKVYDEAFYEVVALSQLKAMTQNDLLRWLVRNVVNDLDEGEKKVYEYLRDKAEEAALQKKNI